MGRLDLDEKGGEFMEDARLGEEIALVTAELEGGGEELLAFVVAFDDAEGACEREAGLNLAVAVLVLTGTVEGGAQGVDGFGRVVALLMEGANDKVGSPGELEVLRGQRGAAVVLEGLGGEERFLNGVDVVVLGAVKEGVLLVDVGAE